MKKMKKMKKIALLLFTTIFLSSCNIYMGSNNERHLIVCEIRSKGVGNSNNAVYTVKSFNNTGHCYNGLMFEDQYGKFQIGDTVELVKLKH